MEPRDLLSRAGKLLYRELPEEYRYRDPRPAKDEAGDLEAYLHAFGHLFDLVRGTTEQAYSDAFAEPVDDGPGIQPWLIPYLAELVGAELRAPDPKDRRRELNETVSWYKSKGSLQSIDEIADVVSGDETVVVEGWRRTLVTPRMALPPFTAEADAMGDGEPTSAPALPQGTPDSTLNRAVADPNGSDPLYALRIPQYDKFGREVEPWRGFWRPLSRRGHPCFPGAFDDTALRCPDMREHQSIADPGPNPHRTIIHVRPPDGFFVRGLDVEAAPKTIALPIDKNDQKEQVFDGSRLFGTPNFPAVDEKAKASRMMLKGDLVIPAKTDIVFRNLLFLGEIRLADKSARLRLENCAVSRIKIDVSTPDPIVRASNCLFEKIEAPLGFMELVHCTVLESTEVEVLHASDCIFADGIKNLQCSGDQSCIRYSAVPNLSELSECGAENSPSNTSAKPNFISLCFPDGDDTSMPRHAAFGEPGAGVLDLTSNESILHGAENEGEMGAYNHLYHAARIRALRLKFEDHLPFGQEIAIAYDRNLSRKPPEAVE